MKKNFASIVLSAMIVASLTTACGGKPAANTNTTTPAATTTAKTETTTAPPATTKTEPTSKAEGNKPDSSGNDVNGEFTLLDVSTDMIEAGVYALSEDGTELVFSMFTEPSGTPMASLFVFPASGEGDVICGAYTAESETDENGIAWTLLTGTDAYTEDEFKIGFGESDDAVYIFDIEGNPYEGKYLSADETIDYMGQAVVLLEKGAAGGEANGNETNGGDAESFTLLDVSTDMIQTGVYALSEDGTELVFSMFNDPSGTPMASLFAFPANGKGDVICGTYTAESEKDEDGITWSLLTVSDVYTGEEFGIGFGELGDQIYILDSETAYEGKYLSADETIVYMGTAAALLEE